MAQRRHPRVRPQPAAARRCDRQYTLAPRPLERKPASQGGVPGGKIYTTRAVDGALAPGGFLVRNVEAARERLRDPNTPQVRREETELFVATMDAADALRPDIAVERSAAFIIAGRRLSVRVAADAVTAADFWLYDEATSVAVIGDLVTLPAPFFETACPARWQGALDEVWATPFRLAVPGHGPPMSRAEFDTYRRAFGNFRGCVASENTASVCAANWTKDLGTLLTAEGDRREATDTPRTMSTSFGRMAVPAPTARRSNCQPFAPDDCLHDRKRGRRRGPCALRHAMSREHA